MNTRCLYKCFTNLVPVALSPYLHLATSEMWCWSGERGRHIGLKVNAFLLKLKDIYFRVVSWWQNLCTQNHGIDIFIASLQPDDEISYWEFPWFPITHSNFFLKVACEAYKWCNQRRLVTASHFYVIRRQFGWMSILSPRMSHVGDGRNWTQSAECLSILAAEPQLLV